MSGEERIDGWNKAYLSTYPPKSGAKVIYDRRHKVGAKVIAVLYHHHAATILRRITFTKKKSHYTICSIPINTSPSPRPKGTKSKGVALETQAVVAFLALFWPSEEILCHPVRSAVELLVGWTVD